MNSISESVHYAVPVICIPLTGDQPLNSYRITTELGLGIELSFVNLTSQQLRESVHKLLKDSSFQRRALFQSKASREFNGRKIAADAILDYAGIL
jgi:UDP:flavonoid glycosyltransferase YjiC (YdhE family)